MHICFIEDTDLHGGTQIWVTEAARSFSSAGHHVTVLTPETSYVARECSELDVRVVTYDWSGISAAAQDDTASRPYREIWSEAMRGCDVAVCTVHPPRNGFHCSVFAAHCLRESALDTILVPKTGTIVPEYERGFYAPDPEIRSSVIAITRFTREALIQTYGIPEAAVGLVYQGTDVDRFTRSPERHAVARARYPLPQNASPILGSVGSFEPRKGQAVLLEALRKLRARQPNAHLVLVGDGPDEAMLRARVADLGLDDVVHLFPFTSEPVHVFELLDVLVLPSLYKEGLPNVLLEAMSMSVPVVASQLAGVSEVVLEGQTGYTVEPGDDAALADAIDRVWSDRDAYRRMSERARTLMVEQFDKKRQFRAFLEHFEALKERFEARS